MEIPKTTLNKVLDYLDDAAKLYDALPMQSMKCRAHMIRQLTDKMRKLRDSSPSLRMQRNRPL